MKILLISANTLREPYPVYPIGLDYVAGAISDRHEVRIIDIQTCNGEQLEKELRQFSADMIGVSLRNVDTTDVTDPQGFIKFYKMLVENIRKHSNAIIVLGGSGLTIFPDEIMQTIDADYGIMGEGERFSLLVEAVATHQEISGIPGIVTRNEPNPLPPAWQKPVVRRFDPKADHLGYYLKNGGMLNLQTKRGCCFNCVYCTYPHIEGHRLRLSDPASVAQTAKDLESAGAKYLYIADAVFNSDSEHNIAVARAFKKVGLTIPWGAFFAPLDPPADYYKILADSGLTHVEFGTESLSDPVLRSYQKTFQTGDVMAAHRAARDAGLYVAHYFLFGGPAENRQTLDKTLQGIDLLDKAVIILFCGLRIYPHTPLYKIAVQEGQVAETDSLLEPVFYRPGGISLGEIIGRVTELAKERPHWVVGAGSPMTSRLIARLYQHGHTGPLWERLI